MDIKDGQDDNVQNDNTQIENQNEGNGLASTGNESWDKLIDEHIEQGTKPDANKTQHDRKTTDNTQQVDPNKQQLDKDGKPIQQQNQTRQQDGQGNVEGQSTNPPRSPARQFGNLFRSDARGDVYDANGALIARQGAQRMIFHRLWPTIEAKDRELNGYRQRLENYENANQIAKQANLSLDEQGAALQMFVQWKKDPVKLMSTLLTMAEQAGRDVTPIRQGGGFDASGVRTSVQEVVAEALKPFMFLVDQQQQGHEQQQLIDEVTTEYNAFMEEFPDAKPHEDVIANVMRDRNVNHREAYFALRAFAAERRLDWTKDLKSQLLAQGNGGGNPSGGGNNRRQLPSMNGRGRSPDAHVENGSRDQANANDSWDAIARRAMRNAGIEI